jgi:ribosomal protein L29
MNKKNYTNEHLKNITMSRSDLLYMRFAKAQKNKFISSDYKKKRKSLAKLLTQINQTLKYNK